MHKHEIKEAWVDIAPDNGSQPVAPGRWALEFRPAMGRLLSAHPTIGPASTPCTARSCAVREA